LLKKIMINNQMKLTCDLILGEWGATSAYIGSPCCLIISLIIIPLFNYFSCCINIYRWPGLLTLPITNERIAFTFEMCHHFASSWTKRGSSFILCCCTIKSYLTKNVFFKP
jgi:hypothetical protein